MKNFRVADKIRNKKIIKEDRIRYCMRVIKIVLTCLHGFIFNSPFFQFNDLLLVCSIGAKIGVWNQSYKVKAEFEVENLEVKEGDNLITEFTFYISNGATKEIELYTS